MTGNDSEHSDLPDRYRIIKRLGTGATGSVFHALDSTLQRDVAIKVLHEGFSEVNVARFQREAQAASRLKHPNVVSVLDFGVHKNSRPYLVMEHLDGIDLQSLLKQERLDPERVCRLFIQLCAALAHANSKDVVHRDIKPSNIIIQNTNGEEQVKIVDFGLARLSDKDLSLTAPGVTLGTPYYLSPEVISGQAADARSDIYSIGCVLFECLTGHPPFEGDSINATLIMHTRDKAPPLQNQDISSGLEQIVSKALEKNPEDRFQTSAELQSALADELNKLSKPETITVSRSSKPTTGSFNYGNIFHTKSLIKIDSRPQKTKLITTNYFAVIVIATLGLTVLVPHLLSHPDRSSSQRADQRHSEQPEQSSKSVDKAKISIINDSIADQVKDVIIDRNNILRINAKYSDDELISDLNSSHITKIFVNDRTITKKLFDAIVSLKDLQSLKLAGVKGLSEDMLSSLEQLPYLNTLYISNSGLDDNSIQILAKCAKLDALCLDDNRSITGSGLGFLSDHKTLQRVYIGQTGVTKTKLREFLSHSPAKLVNIKLSRLKLNDTDIRSLNLRKMRTLDIGYNPITNETIKYLKTACPELHHLNVTGCSMLTDACFAELPDLKTLTLTGTEFETLSGISKIKSLSEVSLDRCLKIGNKAMDELGKLNLVKVSLKDTNVTDRDLNTLVNRRNRDQELTINVQRCPNVSKLEVSELQRQAIKVHTASDEKSRDDES